MNKKQQRYKIFTGRIFFRTWFDPGAKIQPRQGRRRGLARPNTSWASAEEKKKNEIMRSNNKKKQMDASRGDTNTKIKAIHSNKTTAKNRGKASMVSPEQQRRALVLRTVVLMWKPQRFAIRSANHPARLLQRKHARYLNGVKHNVYW